MPKHHLIKSGVVENTVVWDSVPPGDAYPGFTVINATSGGPGWIWNGTTLSPPPVQAVPVPPEISKLQFALGMYAAGKITGAEAADMAAGPGIPAAVDAAISALPLEQQLPARIRVMGMTKVERASPLLAILMAQATPAISDAEMDAYFIAWNQI